MTLGNIFDRSRRGENGESRKQPEQIVITDRNKEREFREAFANEYDPDAPQVDFDDFEAVDVIEWESDPSIPEGGVNKITKHEINGADIAEFQSILKNGYNRFCASDTAKLTKISDPAMLMRLFYTALDVSTVYLSEKHNITPLSHSLKDHEGPEYSEETTPEELRKRISNLDDKTNIYRTSVAEKAGIMGSEEEQIQLQKFKSYINQIKSKINTFLKIEVDGEKSVYAGLTLDRLAEFASIPDEIINSVWQGKDYSKNHVDTKPAFHPLIKAADNMLCDLWGYATGASRVDIYQKYYLDTNRRGVDSSYNSFVQAGINSLIQVLVKKESGSETHKFRNLFIEARKIGTFDGLVAGQIFRSYFNSLRDLHDKVQFVYDGKQYDEMRYDPADPNQLVFVRIDPKTGTEHPTNINLAVSEAELGKLIGLMQATVLSEAGHESLKNTVRQPSSKNEEKAKQKEQEIATELNKFYQTLHRLKSGENYDQIEGLKLAKIGIPKSYELDSATGDINPKFEDVNVLTMQNLANKVLGLISDPEEKRAVLQDMLVSLINGNGSKDSYFDLVLKSGDQYQRINKIFNVDNIQVVTRSFTDKKGVPRTEEYLEITFTDQDGVPQTRRLADFLKDLHLTKASETHELSGLEPIPDTTEERLVHLHNFTDKSKVGDLDLYNKFTLQEINPTLMESLYVALCKKYGEAVVGNLAIDQKMVKINEIINTKCTDPAEKAKLIQKFEQASKPAKKYESWLRFVSRFSNVESPAMIDLIIEQIEKDQPGFLGDQVEVRRRNLDLLLYSNHSAGDKAKIAEKYLRPALTGITPNLVADSANPNAATADKELLNNRLKASEALSEISSFMNDTITCIDGHNITLTEILENYYLSTQPTHLNKPVVSFLDARIQTMLPTYLTDSFSSKIQETLSALKKGVVSADFESDKGVAYLAHLNDDLIRYIRQLAPRRDFKDCMKYMAAFYVQEKLMSEADWQISSVLNPANTNTFADAIKPLTEHAKQQGGSSFYFVQRLSQYIVNQTGKYSPAHNLTLELNSIKLDKVKLDYRVKPDGSEFHLLITGFDANDENKPKQFGWSFKKGDPNLSDKINQVEASLSAAKIKASPTAENTDYQPQLGVEIPDFTLETPLDLEKFNKHLNPKKKEKKSAEEGVKENKEYEKIGMESKQISDTLVTIQDGIYGNSKTDSKGGMSLISPQLNNLIDFMKGRGVEFSIPIPEPTGEFNPFALPADSESENEAVLDSDAASSVSIEAYVADLLRKSPANQISQAKTYRDLFIALVQLAHITKPRNSFASSVILPNYFLSQINGTDLKEKMVEAMKKFDDAGLSKSVFVMNLNYNEELGDQLDEIYEAVEKEFKEKLKEVLSIE
ncbi:MAG: hypothetical protein OHK0017_13430 [Patescibacteria group bacterium]